MVIALQRFLEHETLCGLQAERTPHVSQTLHDSIRISHEYNQKKASNERRGSKFAQLHFKYEFV
jgi:hypothetical protein